MNLRPGISIEGSTVVFGMDTNNDGQNAISGKVNLPEGFSEIMAKLKKGEKVEVEAKKVTFAFEGTSLVVGVDTDGDGEKSVELAVDMAETFEEGMDAIKN